jgi:hypothetical protein
LFLLPNNTNQAPCWENGRKNNRKGKVGFFFAVSFFCVTGSSYLPNTNKKLFRTMKLFFLFLVCIGCTLVASLQDFPERARSGRAYKNFLAKTQKKSVSAKSAEPLIYNSRLDNFDANNNATFAQRYYVNDEFWEVGSGPVFFLISGEGTCTGPPTGYVAALGEQYKALLVTLEHRFYGESVPNGDASTENYQYLNVQQALADLSSFTNYYKSTVPTSQSVPWVIFGGSYSGGLSSWYRASYPEQSVGALSSSGVVNCIVDFYQFDMQVQCFFFVRSFFFHSIFTFVAHVLLLLLCRCLRLPVTTARTRSS